MTLSCRDRKSSKPSKRNSPLRADQQRKGDAQPVELRAGDPIGIARRAIASPNALLPRKKGPSPDPFLGKLEFVHVDDAARAGIQDDLEATAVPPAEVGIGPPP